MKDYIPEHNIQKDIFNRLVGADSMRYSELKPKKLEASLFMYHLKELMKFGLVEKVDKKYTLTAAGLSTANRFSIKEQSMRMMPSSLSILVLTSKTGEWLLYRRKRQPYINSLGFPSGKIHLGDKLIDAAYRELDEKCGYDRKEVDLTYRGVFNLVQHEQSGFKNHIIGHVWTGVVKDMKTFKNSAGETFWGDWKAYPYDEFIAGPLEIIEALNTKKFFGIEIYIDERNS